MNKYAIHISFIILLFCFCNESIAQGEILEHFITKDQNNYDRILKDRLDNNYNYLIAVVNLTAPKSTDKIRLLDHQLEYWENTYRLKVIAVTDQYYKQDEEFEQLLLQLNITTPILRSKKKLDDVGIYYSPQILLKPAHEKEIIKIFASDCGAYERVFHEQFKLSLFSSLMDSYFEQYSTLNCQNENIIKYTNSNDTIINHLSYKQVGPLLLHQDKRSKRFTYFNSKIQTNIPYLAYDYGLCSNIYIQDFEKDATHAKVIDIIETDDYIRLITDKYIVNSCGLDSIRFELRSDIGTNAGLIFDIENDHIVSRLICHHQAGEEVYTDTKLNGLCQYNSTYNHTDKTTIDVYPNPSTDYINIGFSFAHNRSVQLYNIQGQLLLNQDIHQLKNKISLEHIPATGMYIMEINQDQNLIQRQMISIIK